MKKAYKISLLVGVSLVALAVATRDTPKEKEVKHIRRGNALFEKGEYKKARLEYKNAAKIMPTDPEIAYRWGLVDEAENDIRNAFVDFYQSEQQNPHYRPALLKLAHYHIAGNNLDEAQKRVDTVLKDTPDDPEAHALQAALLLRKKDFEGTEKEARFTLSKEPANITATSVLTGLYSAQGDIAKAGATIDEGIAKNPGELSLLTLKAMLYENANDLAKTTEAYQDIFKLKPKDSQFRVYLSNIYLKAGKLDEAEKTLRDAVTTLPDDMTLKHQLIVFLDSNRNTEAAEKEIRGYIQAYPDKNDFNFWLADLYITHNDVDKAVTLLEKIVSKDQDTTQSLNAQTSLARINFVKGNKELAEKMAEAVLKKKPSNREALYVRANLAAERGAYQNAVSDLRLIIRDQPKAKDALQLLGEVLLLQGYTDLAIETLNQLIEADPTDPAPQVRLTQLYAINGDSPRSLKMLAAINKNYPLYAIGWENTARIAISTKDYTTAKAAITILDTLDGQHALAMLLEGQIAAASGKNEDAVADYTKVIDADPSSPLAIHALMSLVLAQRNPQELEKTTAYIAALKTDSPFVSTILGECYLQIGKMDQAAAAFDKAIAHDPKSQDPYIYRARLYMSEKKSDEALALLTKSISVSTTDLRAPMLQADILNQIGKSSEAIALYEDILKTSPKLDDAANNMASIIADHAYSDSAMLEKARQTAERFVGSSNPVFLDTLAWVYYRQGKMDQAQSIMARAISLNDKKIPPEHHYHYGAILLQAGKPAQAKTELTLSTAEGANYPELDTAKKLLQGIKE